MKRKSFLTLLFVCVTAICISVLAGCNIKDGNTGNGGGSTPVAVESVTVTPATVELTEGETAQLYVTVLPANAADKSVAWESDKTAIATVSSQGLVTAVAAGTATVTAKTANGKSDACTVTVKAKQTTPVKPEHTSHDYKYTDLNETSHKKTCTGCTEINVTEAHVYDNGTDTTCNLCEHVRTVEGEKPEHTSHSYKYTDLNETSHKKTCTGCTEIDETEEHVYDNGTDTTCNLCDHIRTFEPETPQHTSHSYKYTDLNETSHKKTCTGCAEVNVTEAHVYDNGTDTTCNLCEHIRTVEPVTPSHTSHSYKHTDLNETSHKKTCTGCTEINVTEEHVYDNGTDTTCNLCDHIRTVEPVTPVKYTVTFISDGEILTDLTEQVEEGKTVKQPTGMTKDGYTFKHWAVGSENGAIYNFTEPVDKNLNLHAVWEKNQTPVTPPDENTPITYSYAGNECAAFEWTESNAANAKVEYKKSTESSYAAVDKQLIRDIGSGKARVDIVGLAGGVKYDFKITTSENKSYEKTQVEISKYDRSGYAHFNYTQGVGAYKEDGTPKSNAKIIYLTEANKNDVDGKGNSIAQYLKNSANNSTPIIIRVIGTVGSATWNLKDYGDKYGKASLGKTPLTASLVSQLTPRIDGKSGSLATSGEVTYYQDASSYNYKSGSETLVGVYNTLNLHPSREDGLYDNSECAAIKGLNSYMKVKSGEYDSCWNDCSISNVTNVTIEGIGEDAEIFQWGFTFKNSSSIEVRNLHFDDYTEDGCSFEGSETGVKELSAFKSGNIWLHHNTFDEGMNYWDVCAEQDKGDGDGSTDFKGLKNITIAYNHYISTHKTNLIGGGDSVSTANVTFHHNYYESCNQRMPLGRQANMHMYNNYYSGSTLYSISLRAGAYAFIENCYFTEDNADHYPVELVKSTTYGTPAAKIINCSIDKNKANNHNGSGDGYLYIGTDRSATVNTADQRFAKNFDTNAELFYYDTAKKVSKVEEMLTAENVKTVIPKVAGVQKRGDGSVSGGTTEGGNTGTGGGETTKSGTVIIFSGGAKALVNGNLSETLTGVTVTATTDTSFKSNKFVYNGVEYNNSYKLDSKGEVTVRLTETKEVTFCYYEYNGKTNPQISIGGETYGGGDGTTDSSVGGRYFTVKVTLTANTDYKIIRLNGVEVDLCYMIIG